MSARTLLSQSACLLTLALGGCMLSPTNGDSIGVKTTSVVFSGFDAVAGSTITIEARDPIGNWVPIGSTTASTMPFADYYPFSVSLAVPDSLWKVDLQSERFEASLRASSSGGHLLLTYEPGEFNLNDPVGSASPESPVVTIVSEFRSMLDGNERAILNMINAARANPHDFALELVNHLDPSVRAELMNTPPRPPLRLHPDLMAAARFHSEDLAGCNPQVSTHTSCDGTSFGARIGQFYNGQAAAENVFYYPGANAHALVVGWMNSTDHRNSIMNPAFEFTGIAGAGAYWTQTFGG